LIKAVADRYLRKQIVAKDPIGNSKAFFDYLYHTLRDKQRECFVVCYLDARNRILDCQTLFVGTLTASAVYPREVLAALADIAARRHLVLCADEIYDEMLYDDAEFVPLATLATMLALAFVTRFSGMDVTLGLALTGTGAAYPFFAAVLGWLGVAITGSDTSSNAMFGSLQKVTAEQLGLDPLLICTANSTGGVMGKMIDAQSIVVAATATGVHRQEGAILRRVFPHSLSLAALVGLLVWLQAGPLAWTVRLPVTAGVHSSVLPNHHPPTHPTEDQR